jgi:hypothetical protein
VSGKVPQSGFEAHYKDLIRLAILDIQAIQQLAAEMQL